MNVTNIIWVFVVFSSFPHFFFYCGVGKEGSEKKRWVGHKRMSPAIGTSIDFLIFFFYFGKVLSLLLLLLLLLR